MLINILIESGGDREEEGDVEGDEEEIPMHQNDSLSEQ